MVEYRDRWIECTGDGIRIRGYYFPWGTKSIAYEGIRSVTRVALSAGRGRARIWGTANPRYWASLDPRRSTKPYGLILDVGHFVHPFITPDDCDRAEAVIRDHAHLGSSDREAGPAPII